MARTYSEQEVKDLMRSADTRSLVIVQTSVAHAASTFVKF